MRKGNRLGLIITTPLVNMVESPAAISGSMAKYDNSQQLQSSLKDYRSNEAAEVSKVSKVR
jgi:hypothetical protein